MIRKKHASRQALNVLKGNTTKLQKFRTKFLASGAMQTVWSATESQIKTVPSAPKIKSFSMEGV